MTDTISRMLGEATVQELRKTVHGRVLTSEEDAYTEAAHIWNGAFDGRSPALVVHAADDAFVSGIRRSAWPWATVSANAVPAEERTAPTFHAATAPRMTARSGMSSAG